jgi:hypothetical protein
VDQSGFYLLPAVVRTYAPVGQTPVLREKLSRDHLSVISAISLEGRLYMMEQERAFKGKDVVRFLKHLMRQIPGKLLVSYGTALRFIEEERSRTSWRAERLVAGCNWSNYPVMLRISTPTRGSGSTLSAWS